MSRYWATNICFKILESQHVSSPVLVEPTLALIADVLGEDGLEGTQAAGSVDVSNDSNHDHGSCLHIGQSLHHFIVTHLRSRSVDLIVDVNDSVTFIQGEVKGGIYLSM